MEEDGHGSAVLEKMLDVFDEDGTLLGHLSADLFMANKLVIEVKACRALVDELINVGGQKFQIKKYILSKDA